MYSIYVLTALSLHKPKYLQHWLGLNYVHVHCTMVFCKAHLNAPLKGVLVSQQILCQKLKIDYTQGYYISEPKEELVKSINLFK